MNLPLWYNMDIAMLIINSNFLIVRRDINDNYQGMGMGKGKSDTMAETV
jgi:hypothetical protein